MSFIDHICVVGNEQGEIDRANRYFLAIFLFQCIDRRWTEIRAGDKFKTSLQAKIWPTRDGDSFDDSHLPKFQPPTKEDKQTQVYFFVVKSDDN